MGYNLPRTHKLANLLTKVAHADMQDFSRLIHLCHYALQTQHVPGDVVEFGCFTGQTSMMLTAIFNRTIWLYDSFEGLPDIGEKCQPGAMKTTYQTVINNFIAEEKLPLPRICAGWFHLLRAKDLPSAISFAHIDGDLYASTRDALGLVYPRMSKGGVILVDDYDEPYFAGPKRATDEFFAKLPEKVVMLPGVDEMPSYKALIVKL